MSAAKVNAANATDAADYVYPVLGGPRDRYAPPRRAGMPTLPRDQHADHQQVETIGDDAGRERRRVSAVVIVEQAGEPTAGGHAAPATQQERRNAP